MKRHKTMILFVILLVAIAGCSDTVNNPATPEQDQNDTLELESRTPFQGNHGTSDYQPDEDGSSNVDNPWNSEKVVVGIGDGFRFVEQKHLDMINNSINYWETNPGAGYRKYDADLVLVPNSENPDILIRFVPYFPKCKRVVKDFNYDFNIDPNQNIGCAPLIKSDDNVYGTVHIVISTKVSDQDIEQLLMHEFGHVFGIDHGEKPRDIMAHQQKVTLREE